MKINKDKFSHNRMTEKLGEILDNHYREVVGLKLPKLQKVAEPV